MNAIEFSTKIHQGIIKLPYQYEEEYENMEAKVIVLFERKDKETPQKEKLKAIFSNMKSVNMFSSIEDPVAWQKQQRDEWK